jgi:hypothetical protein
MTFGEKVLKFYKGLKISDPLPEGIHVMNPYQDRACMSVCKKFYLRYYNDTSRRFVILGINPGRYGAGITGIPFTDPIKLETLLGIPNDLQKKPELSAEFIHRMIAAFGGHERFFSMFFINSVSPLGFLADGKNLNYYDTPLLRTSLEPFIRKSLHDLMDLGIRREIAYCLGEGENYKYIKKMNSEENFFEQLIPLAHPRFIMQYRRKQMDSYVQDYIEKLSAIDGLST